MHNVSNAVREGYHDGVLEQIPTLVNLQCDIDHPTQCMADMLHVIHEFGGVENPKVYLDDQVMRMCKTHRIQFTYLAEALIAEGDTVKAKKVLEYVNKVIPASTVPHDYSSNMMALYYYELGMKAQGDAILDAVAKNSVEYLTWYAEGWE